MPPIVPFAASPRGNRQYHRMQRGDGIEMANQKLMRVAEISRPQGKKRAEVLEDHVLPWQTGVPRISHVTFMSTPGAMPDRTNSAYA